jgi:hypothetical protein
MQNADGLRDERESAAIAVRRLFDAWKHCAPDDAFGILVALNEAVRAYTALSLEIIALEEPEHV